MDPHTSPRYRRLFSPKSGRALIVPMDHGVTLGAVPGLVDLGAAVAAVSQGGADAVVLHKGAARAAAASLARETALIVHLSASLAGRHVTDKVQVCAVREALRMGADAVSVHVNFGSDTEPAQLRKLGRVARSCQDLGLPLLVMAYARGPGISERDPALIAHAARAAAELGADLVKCPYTGDRESFARVARACPVPVVIAGGERGGSARDLLRAVADALAAGAAGVSIGRNVFAHEHPALLTRQLARVIHEGVSPEEADDELRLLIATAPLQAPLALRPPRPTEFLNA